MTDVKLTRDARELQSKGAEPIAQAKLAKRKMKIPSSIDELISSFENPHIPLGEILAREEGDFIYFEDEEKAHEASGACY